MSKNPPSICKTSPLVLVGAGKMGSAMLEGWISSGLPGHAIQIIDPGIKGPLQDKLHKQGIVCHDTVQNVPTPSVLCLAVKPQIMADVLQQLRAFLHRPDAHNMVVCSIAAGIRADTLADAFGAERTVIRAMPNLPASVQRGVTALFSTRPLRPEIRLFVEKLFQCLGESVWLEEEEALDIVTALSGSGPAYVFHLVEAMAAAGEKFGLPPETATTLARLTVIGAGELLYRSDEQAATLRQSVTSPQGTTAAGLSVLMAEDGLVSLMEKTIRAAQERSAALGQKVRESLQNDTDHI